MKIVTGDIWEYPADVVCIPTNGFIKRNGTAVMGRGVARQARQKFTGLEFTVGDHIKHFGNVVGYIDWFDHWFLVFPTKHHWSEPSDLDLIEASARQLRDLALADPTTIFVLPRPGCGNGGLDWEEVGVRIAGLLPDNVHVIDREVSSG